MPSNRRYVKSSIVRKGWKRSNSNLPDTRASKRPRLPTSIPRSLFSLPIGGFPPSKMVRFRYAREFSLDPSAGATNTWNFSANNLHDPDVTGVGHQPLGFDQNMALYDHYRVTHSQIQVRNTTPGNRSAYLVVALSDSTIDYFTSVEHLLESRAVDTTNPFLTTQAQPISYDGTSPWIKKTFISKAFFGSKHSDERMQGTISSGPPEQAYFKVVSASVANNEPTSMNYLAIIDFWAVLTEPKIIAQS